MKPLVMETICEQTIWGNNNLSLKRNHSSDKIGTWWEVSAHPYCSNHISNLDGNPTLQEVIDENPEDILGPGLTLENCLRLAYLDAKENLSIQVHPGDDYAKTHAKDNGKTESWYIIDCKPGATLVAGTKTENCDLIRSSLQDHTITKYLRKWQMHPGDFIVIPSGTLHALGKDILALEVGTNSNTTYRFYDYDRKDANGKKRPLHLKESFDVLQADNQPIYIPANNQSHRLCDIDQFTVDELYAQSDTHLVCTDSYFIVSNISSCDVQLLWQDTTIILPAYSSAFIPFSAQKITICKDSHVLISKPKRRD